MNYNYVKRGNQIVEIKRYTGGRVIARFSHILYSFGGSFIPPGQYSFPFVFKTGEDYPASFSVFSLLSRTNQGTTTQREELNTKCRLSSDYPTNSEQSRPKVR